MTDDEKRDIEESGSKIAEVMASLKAPTTFGATFGDVVAAYPKALRVTLDDISDPIEVKRAPECIAIDEDRVIILKIGKSWIAIATVPKG